MRLEVAILRHHRCIHPLGICLLGWSSRIPGGADILLMGCKHRQPRAGSIILNQQPIHMGQRWTEELSVPIEEKTAEPC